jgi:hypothetical protein
LLTLAIVARVSGLVPMQAYPTLHVPIDAGVLGVAIAVPVLALIPFADRRGIGP